MRLPLILAVASLAYIPHAQAELPATATQLFVGNSTAGWEFVNPDHASLESILIARPDGVVSVSGKPLGYLQTTAAHADYHLHAEWRWSEKPGNGGVLVHIASGAIDRNLWPLCFQIQTKHTRTGDLLPMAGATFAEPLSSPPDAKTPVLNFSATDSEKPAGEWNTCDIVCRGDAIEVSINGVIQNRVTQCAPAAGRIGFQLEGNPYELRNVWIRPLK